MRNIFLVSALCLILGISSGVNADETIKTITFGYTPWKPIYYLSKDGEPRGIYAEILEEIFEKKLGYKVVFKTFPWKRCQKYLELGKIDFTIMMPSEERLKYSDKSQNVFYDFYLHVFTYEGHPLIEKIEKIRTVDDIKRLEIIPVTNAGNGWHKKNIDAYGIQTIYLNRESQIFPFLSLKRADIIIDVLAPSLDVIREHNLQDSIQVTAARFGPTSMHLMMSKLSKHRKLLPAIDKAFGELKANGDIRRIVDKYERNDDFKSVE
ncbi:substrate-binding periplasmic protein [Desulforhopalus sp. 52FAK]